MRIADLDTGTVYEITQAGRRPGMILSLTPYVRGSRHGLAPDPAGLGFGHDAVCLSARGMLALTAHGFGELLDARIAGLPDAASRVFAHIEATATWLFDLPNGYTLDLVRPQEVRGTWAARLERAAAVAIARAKFTRQAAERKVALAVVRDRLRSILGDAPEIADWQWGSYSTTVELDWVGLERLCRRYVERTDRDGDRGRGA